MKIFAIFVTTTSLISAIAPSASASDRPNPDFPAASESLYSSPIFKNFYPVCIIFILDPATYLHGLFHELLTINLIEEPLC
jgi:hypothetical protein